MGIAEVSAIKKSISDKLLSRKSSGWRDMCFASGTGQTRLAFIGLTCDALAAGREQVKARAVTLDMLFNGVDILDVDVLMRLK